MNDQNSDNIKKKYDETLNEKRIVQSEEIFRDKKEVIIIHGSESYRLLLTKNGKLILIK